ncbi:D-tyrosyl-tRNA(Tyr) deacylase [Flavobacteriaceae bacterium Ap0902]|nr:D-tyrosyl-tRNA(Tyr) deacylase [Flavobacteriaceae bacterium Ap0902]
MRAIIQRVKRASVTVEEQVIGNINQGLLVLIGFEAEENQDDFDWMIKKITQLRIFNDAEGVMNLSLLDIKGELLVVSQFTLHANSKKGNRPSYIRAAKPDVAIPYYEKFVQEIQQSAPTKVQTGEFGADMQVSLLNDGPVTIILDSKQKDF